MKGDEEAHMERKSLYIELNSLLIFLHLEGGKSWISPTYLTIY